MADNPIATAYVEVRPKIDSFQGDVERQVAGTVQTIGQAFASVQLGQYLVGSLSEFDEARDIAAQTAAAIRSTGAAANVTAEDVADLSGRLSEMAAVDDDLIQQGANLLLTFTNIRNEVGEGNNIFDRATEALVDMSAALGTDAAGSAVQLGKALNDPIAGLTALSRAGVSFSAEQKQLVRDMVESGQLVEAQSLILDELARQFGGSAAAQASGIDRLNVATGNLKESIGGALAPVLEQVVPLVQAGVEAFEAMPGPMQAIGVAAGGIAVAARPINEAITLVRTLRTTTEGTSTVMSRLGPAVGVAGAAFAGAAIGIGIWNAEMAEAEGRVDKFASDIESKFADTDTFSDFVSRINQVREEARGLREDADNSINPLDVDYRRELNEGADAISAIADEQARLIPVVNELAAATGDQDGAFRDVRSAVGGVTTALDQGYTPAQVAAQVAAGAFRHEQEQAPEALAGAAEGLEDARDAAQDYADALDDAYQSLRDLLGIEAAPEEALIDFRDTLRELLDTAEGEQRDYADALDAVETAQRRVNEATTEDERVAALEALADAEQRAADAAIDGQERRDAIVGRIINGRDAVLDYGQALLDQGETADTVVPQINAMIDELFATAEQAGLTAEEVVALRDELGLLPEDVEIAVAASGLEEVTDAFARLRAHIDDIPAAIERANRYAAENPIAIPIGPVVPDPQAFGPTDPRYTDSVYDWAGGLGFAAGGVVPGYPGEPRLAMVHGGEEFGGTWREPSSGGVVIHAGAFQINGHDWTLSEARQMAADFLNQELTGRGGS